MVRQEPDAAAIGAMVRKEIHKSVRPDEQADDADGELIIGGAYFGIDCGAGDTAELSVEAWGFEEINPAATGYIHP